MLIFFTYSRRVCMEFIASSNLIHNEVKEGVVTNHDLMSWLVALARVPSAIFLRFELRSDFGDGREAVVRG